MMVDDTNVLLPRGTFASLTILVSDRFPSSADSTGRSPETNPGWLTLDGVNAVMAVPAHRDEIHEPLVADSLVGSMMQLERDALLSASPAAAFTQHDELLGGEESRPQISPMRARQVLGIGAESERVKLLPEVAA